MKKIFAITICLIIAVAACFGLVACGDTDDNEGGQSTPTRNDNAWFSQEELSARGLANLPAPQNLTGKINTDIMWFRNGYFFSQPCPDEETFNANAQIYFDYFKTNYDKRFGVASIKAISADNVDTWYNITQKSELSDYFDDNPSKLYKFYYVQDTTLGDDDCIVKNSVYTFEIRYEFSTNDNAYLFKMIIESADASKNGTMLFHYVLK